MDKQQKREFKRFGPPQGPAIGTLEQNEKFAQKNASQHIGCIRCRHSHHETSFCIILMKNVVRLISIMRSISKRKRTANMLNGKPIDNEKLS